MIIVIDKRKGVLNEETIEAHTLYGEVMSISDFKPPKEVSLIFSDEKEASISQRSMAFIIQDIIRMMKNGINVTVFSLSKI